MATAVDAAARLFNSSRRLHWVIRAGCSLPDPEDCSETEKLSKRLPSPGTYNAQFVRDHEKRREIVCDGELPIWSALPSPSATWTVRHCRSRCKRSAVTSRSQTHNSQPSSPHSCFPMR